MSKGLKKIEGVQSVDVSLNKGLATIELSRQNKNKLIDLQKVVERNGFSTEQIKLKLIGKLQQSDGKTHLLVSGTEDRFEVSPDSVADKLEATQSGREMIFEGQMPFDEEKGFGSLTLTEISSAPRQ